MSEVPQKIGKYEIRGIVGKGAMGVVYNAIDPALGRAVAIKTLSFSAISGSPHESELRLRFLREARSVGMLQHPNIITVHELFEEAGTAYFVMELLEGASLSSILKRKKDLTLGERLSIIDQIAAGLGEAHTHRIVHRDLKPANVFVLKNGVVKVLDFGVAKIGEGELTQAGTVFGTVEYMAPEQVKGASVNPRADVFALGVVAYETLSGRNPFRAETLAASVFKIISDVPERLSSEASRIPSDVDALVFRALAKTEAERFQSMEELRNAIRKAAETNGFSLKPPQLSESDIVVSRELADASAISSVEPQISQWSHVAAQADLLEEVYQRGIAAFNAGSYAECVEKMSQVLDEVPVHSLSLHYLSMSEENLRRERLSDKQRKEVSGLLAGMREAHRRGEPSMVIVRANAVLGIDKESVEARWYRRTAEARLRAVSVGVSGPRAAIPGRSVAGAMARGTGKSFGYAPAKASRFHPAQKREVEISTPSVSVESSSGGKGIWLLAGVGVLFLGLTGVWLSSFGGVKPPKASADPVALPGVRTSPFDGIDADGTVVLQLPKPVEAPFRLQQVIPTSVVVGETTEVGLFGEAFSSDLVVSCQGASSSIVSSQFVDEGRFDVEIRAAEAGEVVLEVANAEGQKRQIKLQAQPD